MITKYRAKIYRGGTVTVQRRSLLAVTSQSRAVTDTVLLFICITHN